LGCRRGGRLGAETIESSVFFLSSFCPFSQFSSRSLDSAVSSPSRLSHTHRPQTLLHSISLALFLPSFFACLPSPFNRLLSPFVFLLLLYDSFHIHRILPLSLRTVFFSRRATQPGFLFLSSPSFSSLPLPLSPHFLPFSLPARCCSASPVPAPSTVLPSPLTPRKPKLPPPHSTASATTSSAALASDVRPGWGGSASSALPYWTPRRLPQRRRARRHSHQLHLTQHHQRTRGSSY
jgi:hypothetical protein